MQSDERARSLFVRKALRAYIEELDRYMEVLGRNTDAMRQHLEQRSEDHGNTGVLAEAVSCTCWFVWECWHAVCLSPHNKTAPQMRPTIEIMVASMSAASLCRDVLSWNAVSLECFDKRHDVLEVGCSPPPGQCLPRPEGAVRVGHSTGDLCSLCAMLCLRSLYHIL